MNTPAVYEPVPVEVARQIGQRFQKDVVVIICIDDAHQLTHTTTWGRSVDHKQIAAALGDQLTAAAGSDLSQKIPFADFRTHSAAEAAQDIDRLSQEVRDLRQLVFDSQRVAQQFMTSILGGAAFARWGLCDAIDNEGQPYQSQWAADVIRRIKEQPLA